MAFDSDRLIRVAAASPVLHRNIVQVGMLDTGVVRYLGEHLGREPFATTARPGDTRNVAATAMGVAALTGLRPDAAYEAVGGLPLPDQERAREALAAAHARGYALDRGQVHPSVYGVAVPIPAHPGTAIGVPMVEVLPATWDEQSRRYLEVVQALRAAARIFDTPPA